MRDQKGIIECRKNDDQFIYFWFRFLPFFSKIFRLLPFKIQEYQMKWRDCYRANSEKTNGSIPADRSTYQRDFDRIIFSSPFRRLQNKTQVFPLPGTDFVHNRLTHSLEVASVGRSIGTIVGKQIAREKFEPEEDGFHFYDTQLSNVVASACLAHDVGNPAFGHSGEDAISNYFTSFKDEPIEGTPLSQYFGESEWEDLTSFEGNANAFRILTQAFKGKAEYGMGLSAACLVSILKYPCESVGRNKAFKHTKKYGFFQSEKDLFVKLANELNLVQESESPLVYKRHPFVYLVEAADDICYNIIDMEDAHRKGILSNGVVANAFLQVIKEIDLPQDDFLKIKSKFENIGDANESIAYLRSKCINTLVNACAEIFLKNEQKIIEASYDSSLLGDLKADAQSLVEIEKLSLEKIYRYPKVLEIEVAGFNVMSGLLEMYVPAVLKEFKDASDKTLVRLIPSQFDPSEKESAYLKTMCVLDHISSMTDAYAVEHYRKLRGIEI